MAVLREKSADFGGLNGRYIRDSLDYFEGVLHCYGIGQNLLE